MERPGSAAVRRLVQAPLSGTRDRSRDARAAHGRHPAQRRRDAQIDGVRASRLHHDRADAQAVERPAAEPCPAVAAVRRPVDPGSRNAARSADVRLTGPDVDGLSARVVRIDVDAAGRVDAERAAKVLPVRLTGQRVLRPPDSSACSRDVHPAVARLARRSHSDRRRPAACDVRVRHVEERRPEALERIERLAGADRDPRALPSLAFREWAALRLLEGFPCGANLRDRDRLARVRALHERRLGARRRTLFLFETRRQLRQRLQMTGEGRRLLAADILAAGAPPLPRIATAASTAAAAETTTSSPTSAGRVLRARVIGLPFDSTFGAAAGVGTNVMRLPRPSDGRPSLCRVAYIRVVIDLHRSARLCMERYIERGPTRAGPLGGEVVRPD